MMFRHWQRHTAYVPKGFLRNTILRMLSQQDMSGSEIMKAIEKETEGRWRPSPGSVYPLLAWFVDNGFIKESVKSEDGIKRYTLTENGKNFLKEAKEKHVDFVEPRFMMPPIIGWGIGYPPSKEAIKLRNSFGRLFADMMDLKMVCDLEHSKETLEEVSAILAEASEKIEKIIREKTGETHHDKSEA
ncbi:MAG: PadR family transcriptional regulator [Nitrososphaeria archaeon]